MRERKWGNAGPMVRAAVIKTSTTEEQPPVVVVEKQGRRFRSVTEDPYYHHLFNKVETRCLGNTKGNALYI